MQLHIRVVVSVLLERVRVLLLQSQLLGLVAVSITVLTVTLCLREGSVLSPP
jgi:hypothetical protein